MNPNSQMIQSKFLRFSVPTIDAFGKSTLSDVIDQKQRNALKDEQVEVFLPEDDLNPGYYVLEFPTITQLTNIVNFLGINEGYMGREEADRPNFSVLFDGAVAVSHTRSYREKYPN